MGEKTAAWERVLGKWGVAGAEGTRILLSPGRLDQQTSKKSLVGKQFPMKTDNVKMQGSCILKKYLNRRVSESCFYSPFPPLRHWGVLGKWTWVSLSRAGMERSLTFRIFAPLGSQFLCAFFLLLSLTFTRVLGFWVGVEEL